MWNWDVGRPDDGIITCRRRRDFEYDDVYREHILALGDVLPSVWVVVWYMARNGYKETTDSVLYADLVFGRLLLLLLLVAAGFAAQVTGLFGWFGSGSIEVVNDAGWLGQYVDVVRNDGMLLLNKLGIGSPPPGTTRSSARARGGTNQSVADTVMRPVCDEDMKGCKRNGA